MRQICTGIPLKQRRQRQKISLRYSKAENFDILPSSPSLTVPVGEKASVKAKSEEKPAVSEKHTPPVIKLDAPSVDSLTDADDIPGADRRRRDNGGTMAA